MSSPPPRHQQHSRAFSQHGPTSPALTAHGALPQPADHNGGKDYNRQSPAPHSHLPHPAPSSIQSTQRQSQCGFTLVELLVIIAITAVLLAFIFVKAKSGLESAKSAKCVQNLKQLAAQTMVYVADYGFYPRMIHQVDGLAVPGTFYENIMNSPVKTCAICPSAKFTGYSKNNRPQEGYGGNPLVLALHIENTNQPGRPTLPPVRPVQIARPSQVILLTDGAQFTANGFALGMSTIWYGKFNGLPGNPSKAETPLTASEVLPGGYWDPDVSQIPLRHNGRANIIFCDGHVTSISAISQLKEKNIYWNY